MQIYIPKPKKIIVPSQAIWTPLSSQLPKATGSSPIIIVKYATTIRERPFKLIVGHPDFVKDMHYPVGDTLYVSIPEALKREANGQPTEIHWVPTEDDERLLAHLKQTISRRRQQDPYSQFDGWHR